MLKLPPISFENIGERIRYWVTIGISCLPPNRSKSIFVLGYPRTGTNWLCTVLNHYTGIQINEFWLRKLPIIGPVILHLHRFVIVRNRTIYMIRDPRDIAISRYHKALADPGVLSRNLAEKYCDAPMTHENLRVNLPGYIRYLFEEITPSTPALAAHFRKARSLGLYTVRYEDMLERGEETLTGIVEFLDGREADRKRVRDTLKATTFEKHTGRKPGVEDLDTVVARKGIAGDWKNQFSAEAARVFDQYAGDLLIEFGYERDHQWVEQLGDSVPR